MKKAQIAVIMTCHNRRTITLSCLQALYKQDVSFDIYLTDDGSSDGTDEAIKANYPDVKILKGNGSLFWVGGMRLAFAEALQRDYEYYLWLNDDTTLESDTLERLLNIHQYLCANSHADSIIVGSTKDPKTGKPTYGGAVKSKRWYSNKFEFLEPSNHLQECDTMYGNCVLIPLSVVTKVGNIDAAFIHSLGDLDYGLRAQKLGCSMWLAPGYVGTCSQNSVRGSWVDKNLSVLERLKKVTHIKNFPVRAWTIFTYRHSGSFWFLYWFLPYIRAMIGYKNLSSSPTFCEEVKSVG
ncbi:glycosyltransferase family 2 protein [Brunnivagina elsteri]|uniref:Glycosyltransferase n=1 Tax=Brunnivagina elsteri CCALA 953 TaxID=987040 RepID=A0A2A2TIB9_9CYAN|nr:glycosyltransferase family 2 protein [Calothrix elsteri]PAX53385.1 glycosyltransferase [Calothrix elsteri CCALA 953]